MNMYPTYVLMHMCKDTYTKIFTRIVFVTAEDVIKPNDTLSPSHPLALKFSLIIDNIYFYVLRLFKRENMCVCGWRGQRERERDSQSRLPTKPDNAGLNLATLRS